MTDSPLEKYAGRSFDGNSADDAAPADLRAYEPHVPRKANEPAKPKHRRGRARRWKVERTHSWLNRARRLLIRWEKKAANYLGFLQLQFTLVTLRTPGVLG